MYGFRACFLAALYKSNLPIGSIRMVEIVSCASCHVEPIVCLHREENSYPLSTDYVSQCINHFPGAVALADERLIGFMFCNQFAPDVLEIANVLIRQEFRNRGIGSELLRKTESLAGDKWASFILVNSTLYHSEKRQSATGFYLNHGFHVVHRTANTSVLVKAID